MLYCRRTRVSPPVYSESLSSEVWQHDMIPASYARRVRVLGYTLLDCCLEGRVSRDERYLPPAPKRQSTVFSCLLCSDTVQALYKSEKRQAFVMNTTSFQPGLLCLRLAAQSSARSTMPSAQFSSMTRARLQLLRQASSPSSIGRTAQHISPRARFASTSTSPTSSPNASMPWSEYFKLRRSRRVWGTVAAIPTTVAGVMIGGG